MPSRSVQFIASTLFILGLTLVAWGLVDSLKSSSPTTYPEQLAEDWQYDLERLAAAGLLPPPWNSIEQIQWIAANPLAEEWLQVLTEAKGLPPSLPALQQEGCCQLRIMLIVWDDEVQVGAIVQYQLLDRESGNLLWEMGRTFVLEERQSLDLDAESPADPETSAALETRATIESRADKA